MKCTSCGANIPDTALFCTSCGTAVSRSSPEQTPAGLTCVQCGAAIPIGNLFCTACGAKAPTRQAPKQQAARPAAVPRPGAGGRTCPVCGRAIAEGYTFCTGCGTPVNAARTAASAPQPRPAPMTVCRSCGASVPADAPYCTACGADMRFGGYEKPKKSRAGLVIGILCAILAAIGIFAALFFTGALDGLLGVDKEQTEQAAAPTGDAAATENDAETDSEPEAETETPSPSPSETPEPSPSPSPEAEASDYLLPDSATRAVTEADLQDLSWRELCLARNEIFARHGRIFKTPEIAQYFESKDWYDGRYSEVTLSALETSNVNFILSYENRHYGHSYY